MKRIWNPELLKKDLVYLSAAMAGGFLFGSLLCFLVVKVTDANDPDLTTIPLGAILSIALGVMFILQETIETICQTVVIVFSLIIFLIAVSLLKKEEARGY